MNPPFRTVGIVGLGLIGGSMALALRRRWPDVSILAVDRADVVAAAASLGAIGETRATIADLREADLVVLATPVPEIIDLLGAAARAGLRAVVTDVGSTKRRIMEAVPAGAFPFVGGHPMAGAAQGGLAYARADLFDGREWLLVSGAAPDADVDRVECLVRGLGATPRRVDAETHDRVMAYLSHLPQLLSTALMATAGAAVGRDGLAAAGPGFADMTRLASSPVGIWRGILATNADYVAEAVAAFVAALPSGDLTDAGRVDALFRAAQDWGGQN